MKKEKYALTETVKDNQLWFELLKSKIKESDYAEFNLLYRKDLLPEIKKLENHLVDKGSRQDKIYVSGEFRRYELTDEVIEFIVSKPYKKWNNYQLEDLSLIKNNIEVLATITHENYIFVRMTEEERIRYNSKGYEFGELFEINFPH